MANIEAVPATVEEGSSSLLDMTEIKHFREKLFCLSETTDKLLKNINRVKNRRKARRKSAGGDKEHHRSGRARTSSKPKCYTDQISQKHKRALAGVSRLEPEDVRQEQYDENRRTRQKSRGEGHWRNPGLARVRLMTNSYFPDDSCEVLSRYSAGSQASTIASSIKSKPSILQMKRLKHSTPWYTKRPIIPSRAKSKSGVCQCGALLQAECGKMYQYEPDCCCTRKTRPTIIHSRCPGCCPHENCLDDSRSMGYSIDSRCDSSDFSEDLPSNPSTLSCYVDWQQGSGAPSFHCSTCLMNAKESDMVAETDFHPRKNFPLPQLSALSCSPYDTDKVSCTSRNNEKCSCCCPNCGLKQASKGVRHGHFQSKNICPAVEKELPLRDVSNRSNHHGCFCTQCERKRKNIDVGGDASKRSSGCSRFHEGSLGGKSNNVCFEKYGATKRGIPSRGFPCCRHLKDSISEATRFSSKYPRENTMTAGCIPKCNCCNCHNKSFGQKKSPARLYDTDELSELCRCKTPAYSLPTRSSGESVATTYTTRSIVSYSSKRKGCCCKKKNSTLSRPKMSPVNQTGFCTNCQCARRRPARCPSAKKCTCLAAPAKKAPPVCKCICFCNFDAGGRNKLKDDARICPACRSKYSPTAAKVKKPHPAACVCADCICPDESDAYSRQFTSTGEVYRPPTVSSFMSQSCEKCPCPDCCKYLVKGSGYHVQQKPAQLSDSKQSRRSVESSGTVKSCHSSRSEQSRSCRQSSSRDEKSISKSKENKNEMDYTSQSSRRSKESKKKKQNTSDPCFCKKVCPCESEVSVENLAEKGPKTSRKQERDSTLPKKSSKTVSEDDEVSKGKDKYEATFINEVKVMELSLRDGLVKSVIITEEVNIHRSELEDNTEESIDFDATEEKKIEEFNLETKEEVDTEKRSENIIQSVDEQVEKEIGDSQVVEEIPAVSKEVEDSDESKQSTESPPSTEKKQTHEAGEPIISKDASLTKSQEKPKVCSVGTDSPSFSKCSCSQYEKRSHESKRAPCVCSECFRSTGSEESCISDLDSSISENATIKQGSSLPSSKLHPASRSGSLKGSDNLQKVPSPSSQPLAEHSDEFKDESLTDAVIDSDGHVQEPHLPETQEKPDVDSTKSNADSNVDSAKSEDFQTPEKSSSVAGSEQAKVPSTTMTNTSGDQDTSAFLSGVSTSSTNKSATSEQKTIAERKESRSKDSMGQEKPKDDQSQVDEGSYKSTEKIKNQITSLTTGVCPNDCGCPDCPFLSPGSWLDEPLATSTKSQKSSPTKPSPCPPSKLQNRVSDISCTQVLDQIRNILCGTKLPSRSTDERRASVTANYDQPNNNSTRMQKQSRSQNLNTPKREPVRLPPCICTATNNSDMKTIARTDDICMEKSTNYGSGDIESNNTFFGFLFSEIKTIKDLLNSGLQKIGAGINFSQDKSECTPLCMDVQPSPNSRCCQPTCCVPAPWCMPAPCCRSSSAICVISVHSVGTKSLLITWKVHCLFGIVGFEVYVDGCLKSRIFSPRRTSTVAYGVDLCTKHTISVVAVMDRRCASVDRAPTEGSFCYSPMPMLQGTACRCCA